MKNAPAWLSETADILDLLKQFIDRLDKQPSTDRKRPVTITLDEKTIPGLFRHGEQADQLWNLIKSLKEDHHIIHIQPNKRWDRLSPLAPNTCRTYVWSNHPQRRGRGRLNAGSPSSASHSSDLSHQCP